MPRAGDAFLLGRQLPRSHDPLQRIDFSPPKLDIDLQDLIDNARQWWIQIGLPLLEETTGIPFTALGPILAGLDVPLSLSDWTVIEELLTAIQRWIGLDLRSLLGGVLPVGELGNVTPERLWNTLFDTAASLIDTTGKWVWGGLDGGVGAWGTTGDGTTHSIIGNLIPVAAGQVINPSVLTDWTGAAGSGQPIRLDLMLLADNVLQSIALIDAIPAGWGADSDGWHTLSGAYTVPAGINQVVTKLTVDEALTAGDVRFKQPSTTKTGLLQQNWVGGLPQAFEDILGFGGSSGHGFPHGFPAGFGEQSDLARMFDNFRNILPGIDLLDPLFVPAEALRTFLINGLLPQNLLAVLDESTGRLLDGQAPEVLLNIVTAMEDAFDDVPIAGDVISEAEQSVWDVINGLLGLGNSAQDTATNNATNVAALTAKVNVVGLPGSPVSVSDAFDGPAGALPAPWDVTHTPGGTGMTLGVDGNGHTQWQNQTVQQVVAVARYPTAMSTNAQYVSWVQQAEQSNVPGPSDAYSGGFGRGNAASTDYVAAYVEGGGGYTGNSASRVHLGFVLAGVYTELDADDVFTAAGDFWELFLGTIASDREFILKRNGLLTCQGTDLGATSAMDASHLFTGVIQATGQGTNLFLLPVLNLPAPLDGFSASDRAAS